MSLSLTNSTQVSTVFFPHQAADVVGTRKVALEIVQMCYAAKDWKALNENIVLLSKRRAQLKQVRSHCPCRPAYVRGADKKIRGADVEIVLILSRKTSSFSTLDEGVSVFGKAFP